MTFSFSDELSFLFHEEYVYVKLVCHCRISYFQSKFP